MASPPRLIAILLVAAHALAASVPCQPDSEAGGAVTRRMPAATALTLLRSLDAASGPAHAQHADAHAEKGEMAEKAEISAPKPPCHEPSMAVEAAPREIEGPIRFFMPACPCGCDQQGTLAGASGVRTGAGVPPGSLFEPTAIARCEAFGSRLPTLPDVTPSPPEPVPRLHTFA